MVPNQTQAEKINRLIARVEELAANRGNWESHWQEIAEICLPNDSRLFGSGGYASTGDKRNNNVFDSTAAMALQRFGAIIDSYITPRNQTWHRIQASDDGLMKNRQVQLYFEEVNRALFKYRYAAAANFASQNQQNFVSLGAYGTGSVFVDKLAKGPGLRYRHMHLGEIYFTENHQGVIDGAYRRFRMTARQLVQKWPNTSPKLVKEKLEKSPEIEFTVYHVVAPREDLIPGRKDFRGMAYTCDYMMKEDNTLLEESGYTSFPYATARYEQVSGEKYGRSPAMAVLPAMKTLNEQKKTVLKQGHRAVDPIYLMHDDGVFDAFSAKPGSTVTGGVTADGRALVQTLGVGNISIGKDLMDDERQVINDGFLVNLFQIMVDTPTMSATEVIERTREKGILLAPTMGRIQSEYLGPLIEREVDVLAAQGLLPKMPPILMEAAGEYRIEYDSPISRTQRAEEASGVMRTIELALQVVNVTQNPEPLDHLDFDEIIPDVATIQGVPYKWKRSAENVASIREARAQNQQTQEDIQAGPAAAAMMKAQAGIQK